MNKAKLRFLGIKIAVCFDLIEENTGNTYPSVNIK